MQVIATAGHVDHGKSTLVRALTGQDPDRLAEEKRRGMTIDLGYCWTIIDSVGEVAFVDVPGHERLSTTMLAGIGAVSVAMLVVAADDPWMPQAAEHLAALDVLGVAHGLVVVSRADLADPSPMLERARQEVDATSLAGAPAVAVSARTGLGLNDLRAVLGSVLASVPPSDRDAPARLWVDRSFHVRGAGTVVTGTLPQGTITKGTVLSYRGSNVRVRGIEALGVERETISGPARVALALGGHMPAIQRGETLVEPAAFGFTSRVDVRLTGKGLPPRRPVLHVGSARVGVMARSIGAGFARLTFERELALRYADRGVLRDPGSRRVWGVEVLDPAPATRPLDLASHDGTADAELRLRGVVRRSQLRRMGSPIEPTPDGTLEAGDWLVAADRVGDLRARLVELAARPIAPAEAANTLGLPDQMIVSALVRPPLRVEHGRITLGTAVPDRIAAAGAVLREELVDFAAPQSARLDELGLDSSALAQLHRAKLLLRADDRVVFLPDADVRAAEVLAALPEPFTASEARRALGTSRRAALALLAYLDDSGRTVRLADDRRLLRHRTRGKDASTTSQE